VLLLAACAQSESPTGIVVEVDTDLVIPSAADALRVRVRSEQGVPLHEVNVDLRQAGPGSQLPGRLALQPEDPGRPAPITVEATALRAGQEVLRQEARLGFRPGAVVLLRMLLVAGCACQRCGPGETCGEGARCGSVARDANALPLYAPGTAEAVHPAPTTCPLAPEEQPPGGPAPDALPDARPADVSPPSSDAAPEAHPPDAGVEAGSPGKDSGASPDVGTAVTLPVGAACTTSAQCGSRSCVDGVCCSSACGSVCMACAKAITGQADGQCAPVKAGTDPRADCAADAPTRCRYDGTCDGAGACRLHVAGTLCGPPSCAAGVYSAPGRCSGAGVCNPGTPQPCQLFACTLDRGCASRCQSEADCAEGAYCATGGDCIARKHNGESCAEDRECEKGACSEGRCAGHR
jgi:hypothetical protein